MCKAHIPRQAFAPLPSPGRRPNIRNLGLEETGVKISDKGAIAVDRLSRTNVRLLFVAGGGR